MMTEQQSFLNKDHGMMLNCWRPLLKRHLVKDNRTKSLNHTLPLNRFSFQIHIMFRYYSHGFIC